MQGFKGVPNPGRDSISDETAVSDDMPKAPFPGETNGENASPDTFGSNAIAAASHGISRRSFVAVGATALAAGVATALTGCAPTVSSTATTEGDRSNVPDDKVGSTSAQPSSTATPTDADITIEAPSVEVKHEIVDSHLHFLDFLEKTDGFPALVRAMDLSGVSQSVIFGMGIAKQWDETLDVAPSYYLSNDSRCYYYSGTDFILAEELLAQPAEIRQRFFPFMCGINGNDRFAADHIRQMLRLYPNFWCGIGELMSRHDDLTALTYGEPPHIDHPAFLEIFDLGAEEGLPVLVHHNITAQNSEKIIYREELERALAHNRKCKIIWAHVGISRRVEIQGLTTIADELLSSHKNLTIDISWVVFDYYFMDAFPSTYSDGDTLDDWVRLIEKWPDRFMIGTDKVGHWSTYPAEVVKYYPLLEKLSEETVRKICRDNIKGLVKTYG